MNRKRIGGLLALLMLGSVLGSAACKGEEGPGGVLKPGTVVTDEQTKTELYDALEGAFGGLSFTASANLTRGAEEGTDRVLLEGTLRGGEELSADIYGTIERKAGEDKSSRYLLCFLRGGTAYTATDRAEGEVSYPALKDDLKEDLILTKYDMDAEKALFSPTAMRILHNLAVLGDGTIVKTEGGFDLVFDTLSIAGKLLEGVKGLAKTVEETAELTIGGLFSLPFLKDTLTTLLDGVGAEELVSLVQPLVPDLVLPVAEAGKKGYDYLVGLLRSGDFFSALTEGSEGWSDFRSLGEVPLERAIGLLSGGELTLEGLGLSEKLDSLAKSLEEELLTGLLKLLGDEGSVKDAKAELLLTFSFDDDRTLLGFTLEGSCTGTIEEPLPPEPEEGENGQEGQGGQEGENGQENEDGREDGEEVSAAQKEGRELKASVKLSATRAKAPELFGLHGCKYYGEDGQPTPIEETK